MRPLDFGNLDDTTAIVEALRQISLASHDSIESVADAFTANAAFTSTRTLNVSSPTTANIAAVLATFLTDLKKRGANRQ